MNIQTSRDSGKAYATKRTTEAVTRSLKASTSAREPEVVLTGWGSGRSGSLPAGSRRTTEAMSVVGSVLNSKNLKTFLCRLQPFFVMHQNIFFWPLGYKCV